MDMEEKPAESSVHHRIWSILITNPKERRKKSIQSKRYRYFRIKPRIFSFFKLFACSTGIVLKIKFPGKSDARYFFPSNAERRFRRNQRGRKYLAIFSSCSRIFRVERIRNGNWSCRMDRAKEQPRFYTSAWLFSVFVYSHRVDCRAVI